jgi:hypothetical protein
VTTRRSDPLGKQALFGAPVQAPPEALATGRAPEGKAALFSQGARRPGTVVVECSGCGGRGRITLVDAGLRLARFSVFLPLRTHPHRIECPACGRQTWCRIDWTG